MSAVRIELAEHDPRWAMRFDEERARLAAALGDEARAIDHFGSTAVLGLPAKPILDILVARSPGAGFGRWRDALRPLGYMRARLDSTDAGEGQWFFRDEPRTRHVHVYEAGSRGHRRHLAFRDALRADAALREEYAALKRRLAAQEWETRDGYIEGKTAFVRRVEEEAMRR